MAESVVFPTPPFPDTAIFPPAFLAKVIIA